MHTQTHMARSIAGKIRGGRKEEGAGKKNEKLIIRDIFA